MNNIDSEYFRLVNLVLEKGRIKKNRTGVDTLGVFGAQCRFNLQEGFPLLTTKKVHFKSIVHELLWFLSGSTNIKYLVDNDVHIWDDWSYKKYYDIYSKNDSNTKEMIFEPTTNSYRMLRKDEFINGIKQNKEFADKWGDLGEGTYGGMWRAFPFWMNRNSEFSSGNNKWSGSDFKFQVDQIQKVINKLKSNPDDRRMLVVAWHPYHVDFCGLPPCHCLFQFHTEELTEQERFEFFVRRNNEKKQPYESELTVEKLKLSLFTEKTLDDYEVPKRRLNCQLYQRSGDIGLGICFNWASYSLLLSMIAQVVNMEAGEFIWSVGDLHIYKNHIEPLKEQLKRHPFPNLPRLNLNHKIKNLFDFKYSDITLEDYECHTSIKMEVAV